MVADWTYCTVTNINPESYILCLQKRHTTTDSIRCHSYIGIALVLRHYKVNLNNLVIRSYKLFF